MAAFACRRATTPNPARPLTVMDERPTQRNRDVSAPAVRGRDPTRWPPAVRSSSRRGQAHIPPPRGPGHARHARPRAPWPRRSNRGQGCHRLRGWRGGRWRYRNVSVADRFPRLCRPRRPVRCQSREQTRPRPRQRAPGTERKPPNDPLPAPARDAPAAACAASRCVALCLSNSRACRSTSPGAP